MFHVFNVFLLILRLILNMKPQSQAGWDEIETHSRLILFEVNLFL